MSGYRRPHIAAREYLAADGTAIPYGTRWGMGLPPEDSYSRESNLDRFAPLQTIADALIDHLAATYQVTLDDDPGLAADLLQSRDDVTRAVRLTSPGGAPLTFVFTSFPSVIVHAGELLELLFPVCGCDACDESWETLADELEWQALAVAAGGLRESVRDGDPPTIETLLESPGIGSIGGEMSAAELDAARVDKALAVLAGGSRWPAWVRR